MTITLPACLQSDTDEEALALLAGYYDASGRYTGAAFDTWDSTGTRERDVDRFTADDLVAVSLLSVDVPARAAIALLGPRAAELAELLAAVHDRDLGTVLQPFAVDGPEWKLDAALKALPGVGPTIATKLYARKRPRLRPIYDAVVAEVLGTKKRHWEPVRQALVANDGALHNRLVGLRDQAGLPSAVSTLRVLDVVAWMEGKARGLG